MERVSREQYERKVKHVQEAPDVKIGHLNPEGQIVEAESAQYVDLVKAVWNPVTRRAELVREVCFKGGSCVTQAKGTHRCGTRHTRTYIHTQGQGTRLTAWVKGGGYLHGYLEDIDPLAEFWDPERIDSSGGVMVMPQLGRIPGEAAKEMTYVPTQVHPTLCRPPLSISHRVAEAIAAMMKYELEAPLGGSDDPMWYAEQEDLQVNLKKRGLYIVCEPRGPSQYCIEGLPFTVSLPPPPRVRRRRHPNTVIPLNFLPPPPPAPFLPHTTSFTHRER